MKKLIISLSLALLIATPSYAQYKEPKLRNNLNIYQKESETKKISKSIKKECEYLKKSAADLIKKAFIINTENNNVISEKEMDLIKDAHYFSVNWSSLCD